NFLTDVPAMAISSDNVAKELLDMPRKWDTKLIRNFMIIFGLESSLFDFFTFGVLLYFFKYNMNAFQSGWFLESVITELLILMIIRTKRPFFKSRPSKYLTYAAIFI